MEKDLFSILFAYKQLALNFSRHPSFVLLLGQWEVCIGVRQGSVTFQVLLYYPYPELVNNRKTYKGGYHGVFFYLPVDMFFLLD